MPDVNIGACANTRPQYTGDCPAPPMPVIQDAIASLEDSIGPLQEKLNLLEIKLAGFLDCPPCKLDVGNPVPSGAPLVRRVAEARMRIQDMSCQLQALLTQVQIA